MSTHLSANSNVDKQKNKKNQSGIFHFFRFFFDRILSKFFILVTSSFWFCKTEHFVVHVGKTLWYESSKFRRSILSNVSKLGNPTEIDKKSYHFILPKNTSLRTFDRMKFCRQIFKFFTKNVSTFSYILRTSLREKVFCRRRQKIYDRHLIRRKFWKKNISKYFFFIFYFFFLQNFYLVI